MRKYIVPWIAVMFCFLACMNPLDSYAAKSGTPKDCSLTLTYLKDDITFSELEIEIYRVANLTQKNSFEKVEPFVQYPVNVSSVSSQVEWNEIAKTLHSYAQADNIQPYMTGVTDEYGNVTFEHLETGLYLVGGMSIEAGNVIYHFQDFVICIPTIENGSYNYDVCARPKSSKTEVVEDKITYTILKLWKDDGNAQARPESVTVDILKDGVLEKTIILDGSNDWTYSFTCPNGKADWSVVERNVPEGYSVTVTEKQTSFVIINTWEEPPEDPEIPADPPGDPEIPVEPDGSEDPDEPEQPTDNPSTKPQTGDIVPLRLWMTAFCLSGMVLLVLGVGMRRKENAFKE